MSGHNQEESAEHSNVMEHCDLGELGKGTAWPLDTLPEIREVSNKWVVRDNFLAPSESHTEHSTESGFHMWSQIISLSPLGNSRDPGSVSLTAGRDIPAPSTQAKNQPSGWCFCLVWTLSDSNR